LHPLLLRLPLKQINRSILSSLLVDSKSSQTLRRIPAPHLGTSTSFDSLISSEIPEIGRFIDSYNRIEGRGYEVHAGILPEPTLAGTPSPYLTVIAFMRCCQAGNEAPVPAELMTTAKVVFVDMETA